MPNLMPYNPVGGLSRTPSRQSRQLNRAMGNLDVQTRLEAAQIKAAADLQAVRVDAIVSVARRGLQNVALLTQLETSLAVMVPMASGRLAAIADMAALSIAEVVNDTAHRVR